MKSPPPMRHGESTREYVSSLLFRRETVASAEALYTTGGINYAALLPGVKRVALGANVYSHLRFCGNCLIRCTACTGNHAIHVLRMDIRFHDMSSTSETLKCKNQQFWNSIRACLKNWSQSDFALMKKVF